MPVGKGIRPALQEVGLAKVGQTKKADEVGRVVPIDAVVIVAKTSPTVLLIRGGVDAFIEIFHGCAIDIGAHIGKIVEFNHRALAISEVVAGTIYPAGLTTDEVVENSGTIGTTNAIGGCPNLSVRVERGAGVDAFAAVVGSRKAPMPIADLFVLGSIPAACILFEAAVIRDIGDDIELWRVGGNNLQGDNRRNDQTGCIACATKSAIGEGKDWIEYALLGVDVACASDLGSTIDNDVLTIENAVAKIPNGVGKAIRADV